ncbi:MAG TPA: glycosyl hydrolase [Bryobacteraceae bacterium]|nr:glycosyl hydrolase [Bryobacteraceae bacterium]
MRILSILTLSLAITAIPVPAAELQWPAVTNETKPWTRWWWLGSIANEKDLTTEMEKYAKAGIGGLEITPIYGVRGREKEFRSYLTKPWMEIFTHSLREGKRLNMGIDMATGNGWPFGGPWVDAEDACRNVVHKTYTVAAGQQLNEAVQYIQAPLVRAIGARGVQVTDIKQPIRENADLQGLALEQVRFEKPLPLVALMAYSDKGKTLDLTSKVDASGKLSWTAPEGTWTLYAVFQGWHGKMVERAGPGGEGDVIDHFSSQSLKDYLAFFDQAFKGHDLTGLRAYFNDSYEVDDASGESNWTPAMFAEFEKRRGYDLREHLPALFGKDTAEKNARVMSDYRETISDLLLDEFTLPWAAWSKSKGAITRNQAHGSPANILDLYAASGIPETEGNDILKFKFASSAAHVTGKRLASAEAATWLDEHFTAKLGDVKDAVDLFFLGDINHICYHGTPFSPTSEAWPGWMFYASVHFGPTNSFWNDFPILNQYVTRVQSFLQAGKPSSDVLLYYPIYDSYAEAGRRSLQHFDGGAQGTGARAAGEELLKSGYTFDFVSDRQLASAKASGAGVELGGVVYKAIVVPQAKYVPVSTVQKIAGLAQGGANILIHNELPASVAGWNKFEDRQRSLKGLYGYLKFGPLANSQTTQVASVGRGRVLLGKSLSGMLSEAGLKREALVDSGIQFVRRDLGDGHAYFLRNSGKTAFEGWAPLSTAAKGAGLFDPMQGAFGVAAIRQGSSGTEAYVQLAPAQSLILRTYNSAPQGPNFSYPKPASTPGPLTGEWTVTFVTGGPQMPPAAKLSQLASWTELPGEEPKRFSGTAKYAITFKRPAAQAESFLLELGEVQESARVILNGEEVGGLIQQPFQVRIPAPKLKDSNTLEVLVSNSMANHIADLDRRGENYRKFYNINFPARRGENRGADGLFSAAKWAPRPSGLIGPVTLTPLADALPKQSASILQ